MLTDDDWWWYYCWCLKAKDDDTCTRIIVILWTILGVISWKSCFRKNSLNTFTLYTSCAFLSLHPWEDNVKVIIVLHIVVIRCMIYTRIFFFIRCRCCSPAKCYVSLFYEVIPRNPCKGAKISILWTTRSTAFASVMLQNKQQGIGRRKLHIWTQ